MEYSVTEAGGRVSGGSHRRRQHIVAMPLPGRGHVNPMMNLCKLLLARGGGRLLVTVVVTEEWLGLLLASSASAKPPPPENLQIHTIPNVVPSERERGADHIKFVAAVLTKMEVPFEELLDRLEPPVDCIVADSFLSWMEGVGGRRNIPVSSLWTQSAAVFLAISRLGRLKDSGQLPVDPQGEENQYLDYLPEPLPSLQNQQQPSSKETDLLRAADHVSWCKRGQSLLLTSFYELEPDVINALRSLFPSLPVYSVGPSIPYMSLEDDGEEEEEEDVDDENYTRWLDSQPSRSVLYVSLGSFMPISSPQAEEMAMGLLESSVRFLWVARGESSRLKQVVGGGGGQRRGVVVAWCEQLRVLCHPSVGGFLTHCGWNSTLEGVFAGVPMLAFPLIWDQYPNRKLIVEKWKVGLTLKKSSSSSSDIGEGGGVVGSEEISEMVKRLMGGEEESRELRRRARELSELCAAAMREGGSSQYNADAFITDCCLNGHVCLSSTGGDGTF